MPNVTSLAPLVAPLLRQITEKGSVYTLSPQENTDQVAMMIYAPLVALFAAVSIGVGVYKMFNYCKEQSRSRVTSNADGGKKSVEHLLMSAIVVGGEKVPYSDGYPGSCLIS